MKKSGARKFTGILFVALIALLSLALLSGCGSSTSSPNTKGTKVHELRWGHVAAPTHPYHIAIEKAVKEVEQKTNGAVKFRIYPTSQLGAQREMVENVSSGALDAVCATTSTLSSFSKVTQVCDLPFIFQDRKHIAKVFGDKELRQQIFGEVEKKIGPVVAIYETGFRQLLGKSPIHSPADMKGKKMRVMSSKAYMRMAECLGASATPMAYGELYTALQQGAVDIADNVTNSIYTDKIFEPAPNVTLTNHAYTATIIIFSPDLKDKIGAENYKILVDTIQKYTDYEIDLAAKDESQVIQKMKDAGVNVYTPTADEMKQFRDACAPIYKEFYSVVGEDLIKKIIAKSK